MTFVRCGAVLLLLASALRAEEPPAPPPGPPGSPSSAPAKPPGPSLDDRLAAVRTFMKTEKWQPALAGLRAVFEEFKGSPEVVRRLPDIEEDLKVCSFRAQEKPPTPEQIFGPGTKSWSAATRQLVMEFPRGPTAPPWEGILPEPSRLRIRFEDVAVEFEGVVPGTLTVELSFDFEKGSGYELRTVSTSTKSSDRADIARLEGAKPGRSGNTMTVVASLFGAAIPGPHRTRFALKEGQLSISEDDRPLLSAKDLQFSRGCVGIRGPKEGSVTVRGRVEAAGIPALLKACSERRFREWAENSWKREEAIPEWARQEAK